MKKIIFAGLLIVLTALSFLLLRKYRFYFQNLYSDSITINGNIYNFYLYKISSRDNLILIPNYSPRLSSKTIIEKEKCKFAINAGFYDENNSPLGIVYSGPKIISDFHPSQVIDGLFQKIQYKQGQYKYSISGIDNYPTKKLDYLMYSNPETFLFQTGPVYSSNSPKQEFNNTKHARRNIIASKRNGDIYIFTFFTLDDQLSGPTLYEIYDIFENEKIRWIGPFSQVINLDGGSASFFYYGDTYIKETNPAGAVICLK